MRVDEEVNDEIGDVEEGEGDGGDSNRTTPINPLKPLVPATIRVTKTIDIVLGTVLIMNRDIRICVEADGEAGVGVL
jgi:hypothetical protein